jgi:hypothetical protein
MNIRNSGRMVAASVLLFLAGCDVGPPDPLLFDDDGSLRVQVGRDEVDAAGVTASCADIDLEAFGEAVRVPVEGEDGVELIGVGALALCIDELKSGEESGDLPGISDVGDDTALETDEASDPDFIEHGQIPDEDDVSGSNNTTACHGHEDTQNGTGTPPPAGIIADPTPEPVGQ